MLQSIHISLVTNYARMNFLLSMLNDVNLIKSGGDKNSTRQFELLTEISEGAMIKYDNLQMPLVKFTKIMHQSITRICQTTRDVGDIIGLWWDWGGIDGYTKTQHIEFYKKGTNKIWSIKPMANRDGSQSLMLIMTRNGKIVDTATQDLTFVPKGTDCRNFVEWLDAGFNYRMVDPVIGRNPNDRRYNLYSTVKKSASDSFNTGTLLPFHLSPAGRNIFGDANILPIMNMGSRILMDNRARLAIQTNPDDPASWVTAAAARAMNLDTLLAVSHESYLSARQIYQDYLGVPSYNIPLYVELNKIKLKDLNNPLVFQQLMVNNLILYTEPKFSFDNNIVLNMQMQKQWLGNNWKIWAVINNNIQKLKVNQKKQPGATDGYKMAIWDKFALFEEFLQDGNNRIAPKDGGFRSTIGAFLVLKDIAKTLDDEFPGMGDVFIRWCLDSRQTIIGWRTWGSADITARGGWNIFTNRPNYVNAKALMNRLAAISEIGKFSMYSHFIRESHRTAEPNSPSKFISFLNHFAECIFHEHNLDIINQERMENLLYHDKNFLKYTEALLIDYATKYLTEIFTMTGLSLENFLRSPQGIQEMHTTWQWAAGTITHLNNLPSGRRFFGTFASDCRLEVPVMDGTTLLSEVSLFDSDFEIEIAKKTFAFNIGGVDRLIPIGHDTSAYDDIFGKEKTRHWPRSLMPARERMPVIDGPGGFLAGMYYDIFLKLKEGRGFAIEVDGGHDWDYTVRKDIGAYSYVWDWNISIISIVRADRHTTYLRRSFFISHHSPLLIDTEWMQLNIALSNNRAHNRLSFEEMMKDLHLHHTQYGISDTMARTLQERFGMLTLDHNGLGVIDIAFEKWWEVFRNSNQPTVNGLANMFWLHN